MEKTAGKQHLTTATSYYLQASCCSILNEWSEALIYYHKAANIYEINKHSSADKIYNLLSVFYYKNNEYKKAIPVLKKALLSHQEKNEEYFEILKKLADSNFKESNFDYVINLIENELKNISEKNIYKSIYKESSSIN